MTALRWCVGVLERVVCAAERPPWHALHRVAIGAGAGALFGWWPGGGRGGWRIVSAFVLVLLVLRLVPAIVRRVVPFSGDAQAQWARQRLLAKRFDSYQWRKLQWIGLGLAVPPIVLGPADPARVVLAGSCLLAGSLAAVRWKRVARVECLVTATSGTPPARLDEAT